MNCIRLVSAIMLTLTCSGVAAPQNKGGAGFDACTLISRSEIEKLMGITLLDGKKEANLQRKGVLSTCDYSGTRHGQISILLRQTSVKYVAGKESTEFQKAGMKLRYVQGLGSTAFFSDISATATALNVFRGDYDFLLITAIDIGPTDEISPNMESVARLLLERWK